MSWHRRALLGSVVAAGAMLKLVAVASAAGMIWIHLCGSYTPGSGSTWGALGVAYSGTSNPGVITPFGCPPSSAGTNTYGMEVFGGGSNVPAGARAYWEIDAPSGLAIVGVHTEGSGMVSYGVNQNMGWGGGFYWQGGGAGAYPGEVGYSSPPLSSRLTSGGRSSAAGAHAMGPPSPVRSASWGLSLRRLRAPDPRCQ